MVVQIINGPGKYLLQASLFDGKEVTFTLQTGKSVVVLVHEVQVESGGEDLHNWNLIGYMPKENGLRFKAYYDSKRRRGHQVLTEPGKRRNIFYLQDISGEKTVSSVGDLYKNNHAKRYWVDCTCGNCEQAIANRRVANCSARRLA